MCLQQNAQPAADAPLRCLVLYHYMCLISRADKGELSLTLCLLEARAC